MNRQVKRGGGYCCESNKGTYDLELYSEGISCLNICLNRFNYFWNKIHYVKCFTFFVNNRFTALLITSIFDFKPYFPCMWDFCLYEYIQVYKYLVWKGIRSILRLGRGGGGKLSETDDIATGMIMVYGSQMYEWLWSTKINHSSLFYSLITVYTKCLKN